MATVQRFWYTSKTGNEGLTDVVIDIKDDSGTSKVSNASMTHAAFGSYYYDYSATASGKYVALMHSPAERSRQIDTVSITVTSSSSSSSTQTQYATTKQVFEFLNWGVKVPSASDVRSGTVLETVDTTGNIVANEIVYLDQTKIINGTHTISTGTSITATTALVEDTDYSIDLDEGKITALLSLGSNPLYAEYKYNTYIDDSVVSDMINRASKWFEEETHQTFGSLTAVLNEEQPGRGGYSRIYNPINHPVNVIKTQLTSAISATATTVTVSDTTGLQADDTLTVEKEQMNISSVDSSSQLTVSRGYNGSGTSTHATSSWIVNAGIQISNTPIGSAPTFYTQEYRSDWDIDSETGAVQLLHIPAEDKDDLSPDVFPLLKTFNRIRMSYTYGTSTVPNDVQRATILLVAKDLISSALSKSLPEGIDGFSPNVVQEFDKEIEKVIRKRRLLLIDGF